MKIEISGQSGIVNPVAEGRLQHGSCLHIVILLFAFNLISAVLFIALVNHPVYDDSYNIFDVHNYAAKGLTLDTLRSQRNAPGPTSFLWMAAAVRVIGGNELRDARTGALFSWLLLGVGVLLGARFSRCPELWYATLLATLVFPHSVIAAATVLTEGPALFFAVIGALAWTESVSRADSGLTTLILGILGSLFMGLAVTCRQYNLALLPAVLLTAVLQLRSMSLDLTRKWSFVGCALGCLALFLVPVLMLFFAWGGIASPGIESGTSYNMMYKASAGLNPLRPFHAALRVGFYLVPLTFPLMMRVKPSYRRRMLGIALLAGIAAAHWNESLLQTGPLNTVVGLASRVLHGPEIPLGLVAAVVAYNAMVLGLALWDQRRFLFSSPPAAFSLFTIIFFIAEQVGVGGNVPFYDRYVLQVFPFMGAIAFTILPSLGRARLFIVTALFFVSQVMVWRYAFRA